MREKFYYLRRPNGNGLHRCGIVYLIEDGYITRGVALCNDIDRFVKDADPIVDGKIGGIQIAKGRALRALNKMKTSQLIKRPEALEKVQGLGIEFKSEIHPVLNRFEEEILKDKEDTRKINLQDGEFRSID